MPTLKEITARFGGEHSRDDGEVQINAAASLKNAGEGDIAFYESRAGERALKQCNASAILIEREHANKTQKPKWIVPKSPRAHFAKLCNFLTPPPPPSPGVSAKAEVHDSATIGKDASIAPFAVVESGASIGDGAVIGANAYIGKDCQVGEQTRISPNVVLYHGVKIGARCIVHAGVVIGADGFGFVADDNEQIKIPHKGGASIGDNVEIGANTCIDRGTLDDTVIADGAKIDNLVQIGHNVKVGRGTVICGCVGIAGSATIGEFCVIGGAADINGHLTIGDNAIIGGSSAVVRDIAAGETVSSVWPAVAASKWRRYLAKWRRDSEQQQRRKPQRIKQ